MSISILKQEQIEQQSTQGITRKIPLVFFPDPGKMYTHRYQRLQTLAKSSPFNEYMLFCAEIVNIQSTLLKQSPINIDLSSLNGTDNLSLSIEHYSLTNSWQCYLPQLLSMLPNSTKQITEVVSSLQKNSDDQLQHKAYCLLKKQFSDIDSNESLFIWASLSLYYTQLASQINGRAVSENADNHSLCPVCNSLPTASIIHFGANAGLRYLHCSLCESEWYLPRIKCTHCDNLQHIHYFSLDDERAAIQVECCDNCHHYLKIFNSELEPKIDMIADDLDSLVLDMKTEEEGFYKSGLNPFLFYKHK